MADVIDLRSDTVTQPTLGMRRAMAEAAVGDDVYGEDPSVSRLEAEVAELVGKEAALFVPTGTMANQLAVQVHTERGDEIIGDAQSHVVAFESGALAALAGVQFAPIASADGLFSPAEVRERVRPEGDIFPRTRVVWLENTHNRAGGTVWPLAAVRAVAGEARALGLATHMDGARLWNAEVASGTSVRDYAASVDTVSVCLSKGLGAPVGSLFAGPRELVRRARRLRHRLGGGMRQAGVLAAAGSYALAHHRERLGDDHAHARLLAQALAALETLAVDVARVQTNIVVAELREQTRSGPAVVAELREAGVLVNAIGPKTLRLVTHLGLERPSIERAAERLVRTLRA